MKKRDLNRSLMRPWLFVCKKALLLMVLLLFCGISRTMADTNDPQNYFKITHHPSVAEPYIEWEYIDSDTYGITDAMDWHDFYIGWDGKSAVKILSYGKRSSNQKIVSTYYGTAKIVSNWGGNSAKQYCRVRFYPNAACGTGPACVIGKNFYIRMVGVWDVDDNGKGLKNLDEKRYVNKNDFCNLISTPEVSFKRTSKGNVKATTKVGALTNISGYVGGLCFTKTNATKTSDIYYYNELGNGSNDSQTQMLNQDFSVATLVGTGGNTAETAPITIYYHRYQTRNSDWGDRQLLDGSLRSFTIKGFQEPTSLQVTNNKYKQTASLSWSNSTNGRNTDGKNAVFRKTDNGQWTKIATLANNATSYVDNTAYVGHEYDYKIMFIPTDYGTVNTIDLTSQLISPLNGKRLVAQEKKFDIPLSASITSENNGGIILSWKPEKKEGADDKVLSYKLTRYNPTTKAWDLVYEGTNMNKADYGLQSLKTYRYAVETSYWNTTFSDTVEIFNNIMTEVASVTASRGIYSNIVKLSWTAEQRGTEDTRFVISRKALNDPMSEYTDIYEVSGKASSYHFDDATALPGLYYSYRVTPYAKIPADSRKDNNGKEWGIGTPYETDGFSQAKGLISGLVTYGTGTAVEGVKVLLEKVTDSDNSDDNRQQFYSLGSQSERGVLRWAPSSKTKSNYLEKGTYTIQMWVKANKDSVSTSGKKAILCMPNEMSVYLVSIDDDPNNYKIKADLVDGGNGLKLFDTGLTVPADQFNNISLSCDGKNHYSIMVAREESVDSVSINANNLSWNDTLMIGGNGQKQDKFIGYVDDIRIWSKCLSQKEISNNVNRILAGNETGLLCYLPLDEGIKNLPYAYDYSKRNGTPNNNHAIKIDESTPETIIPTDDQLALYSITNAKGSYEIRGIPFTGEGTSYIVRPQMGIHEFNANYVTRFVSPTSLTHNAVNFEDISSFPASGVVYYENTTIPVENAFIYVDGQLSSKDGEPTKTNANGEFTVSVPIGAHYIQVKIDNHTFVNAGRYPADPNGVGTTETFEKEITGLTFYDNTLVTVAGRVVGGKIENEKPLGFGKSVANIGQAVLELSYTGDDRYDINAKKVVDGLTIRYEANDEAREFESSTKDVNSTAMVGANSRKIVIKTDPISGEFSAKLPPLTYSLKSITVPSSTKGITFSGLPKTIDASNPQAERADTLHKEGEEDRLFHYVAAEKIEYHSTPQLYVTENADGSFGIKKLEVLDANKQKDTINVYHLDENDSVVYDFGHPAYKQYDEYTYRFNAYEEYYNEDDNLNVIQDLVPLKDIEVTVVNQYAIEAYAKADGEFVSVEENTLTLDEEGKGEYKFQAGLPNIKEDLTRGITITYQSEGSTYYWDGNATLKPIILGSLPTGNNFVTKGPDKLQMILRDPPGSCSSATFSKGSSRTTYVAETVSAGESVDFNWTTIFGVKLTTFAGVGGGTIKTMVDNDVTFDKGLTEEYEHDHTNTTTHTITSTEDVSTSDDPLFVGSIGDVFIGNSTNITLGTCNNVEIAWSIEDGCYKPMVNQGMITSQEFDTQFRYTAFAIENTLIPNLIKARDNLIESVDDVDKVPLPTNGIIYVSELDRDDKKFGLSNSDSIFGDKAKDWSKVSMSEFAKTGRWKGPSYSILAPIGYDVPFSDMVQWYNSSVQLWEKRLADNEKAKLDAFADPVKYEKKNYSFDAGTTITVTQDEATSEEYVRNDGFTITAHFAEGWSMEVAESVGNEFQLEEEVHAGGNWERGNSTENTTTFSYTLQEDGEDDYLTVDVYKAPDGFGPIFKTRGGATCAPFEDEVVTKYYKKGTVLQEKTMQIEKPELVIVDPIVTGVPAGKDAIFKIKLYNNSDTGEDCYYGLWVNPESNPNGAQLFLDGKPFMDGVDLLIPADENGVEKTVILRQSNPDILDYEISLSFYSLSQPDDTETFPGIYSDGTVQVHFQPSCSDIAMVSDKSIVNADNNSPVIFSMSGYDYSRTTFESIRLQYKGENDSEWTNIKEFVKDPAKVKENPTLGLFYALEGGNTLDATVDLSNGLFTNQTYLFRAQTVGHINNKEITTSSPEIRIVRDMARPQLITMPTPTSGILLANDNIVLTFNEDIRDNLLTKVENFQVTAVMNESAVAHEVALNLTGDDYSAKTEATVNLANKPFSVNLWMKYTKDGRILQHGTTGCLFTMSAENGKLVLNVAGKKITSENELPKDKWIYLAISYDNSDTTPVVNAGYGCDAGTYTLIKNQEVPVYEGNGPVSLGGDDIKAMVQELSLWNNVRSLDEAIGDMYLTKNQFTTGLLGYWQMNEGYGLQAVDRSRSRNLTLKGEKAWFLNSGTNYELTLDGSSNVAANAALSTLESESYLTEAWFKADENQNKAATILSMKDRFDIRLNDKGALEMGIRGNYTTAYAASNLFDGQWHHIALNVLKNSNGSAILYLDGNPTRQFAASVMPLLAGKLYLGTLATSNGEDQTSYSQQLKGAIDEVRVWKGSRTADHIKAYMHTKVQNDAQGLVAYYPMEKRGLDEYSQVVTTPTVNEMTGLGAAIASDNSQVATTASQLSLANEPARENVQYHFVASERQISITLDEQPYKLENCNVYFTASNIQDKNGNRVQPINWTVYVQQNQLKWAESEMEVECVSGEGITFTSELENRGANTDVWAIQNLPTWLTANAETGALTPISTQKIKFTVDPGVSVGNYEVTIYAVGSQNIKSPLTLKLKVIGQVPDWNPVPDAETMAIVGQLKMDGVVSYDPDDMLAAFRGQECVGLAHPAYNARYDSYMITMNVYGSSETENTELTYKVYDASTGIIYPSVEASMASAYSFASSKVVGSFNKPVVFEPRNEVEQDLSLERKGWKWFSMYVTPADNSVKSIFNDAAGKINVVKGMNDYVSYSNGKWSTISLNLDPSKMYKLQANEAFAETTIGTPATPANQAITLNGEGWNWIGYPVQASNSVDAAFADADPAEGDIVMSQSSFALYNEGAWVGSLKAMMPGEGYKYFSNAKATKTFHYPTPAKSKGRQVLAKSTSILKLNCEDNMAMIAQVMLDGSILTDATVSVYAGNELCGFSANTDEQNRHFITIGKGGESHLTFVVHYNEKDYILSNVSNFEAGALVGSMARPLTLELDEATAISNLLAGKVIQKVDVYDANGALIRSARRPSSLLNATSLGNVPAGTYMEHITLEDGTQIVQKILK